MILVRIVWLKSVFFLEKEFYDLSEHDKKKSNDEIGFGNHNVYNKTFVIR